MFDLHMHTLFSDGKNSPEDMILEAIRRGFSCVGISDHSHAGGDECGMTPENTAAYRAEMNRLKEKYRGRIRVLCGLERDYYSDDFQLYDYVIGSVHTLRMENGTHICVDWAPEQLQRDVETWFGGDWYAYCEAYYEKAADVVNRTRCDIIGHFDLVSKFQERTPFFDENHPRYGAAWQRAADALLKTGKPFEINTGAISRGYRTGPYPSADIRAYLRDRGAVMFLSSDAHQRENIGFQFDIWQAETCGRSPIGE